jgi:hypothetical protein
VECSGGPLTLETGAAFTPEPGRTYSLWLELGRARQGLSGVTAQAYGSGRTVSVAVKPGMPAVFPELPAKVEGVRVVFASAAPELSLTLRRAVLQSWDKAAPRQNLFSARYLFDESLDLPVSAAATGPGSLTLTAFGPVFNPQWLVLDLATAPWSASDEPPVAELSFGGKHARIPLRSPSSRVAVYLPGAGPGAGPGAIGQDAKIAAQGWPTATLALSGGAPGAGLSCSRAVLAGQRLATWPQVLEIQPLLDLAGRERTLSNSGAGLTEAQAESIANSARWLPMGKAELPAGTGQIHSVRFARNPWLEVEALLLADASGPPLESLGRQAQPAAPGGSKAGKLLGVLAALAALGLAWLAVRRGWFAAAFASLGAWLDTSTGPNSEPLRVKPWLVVALAVLAVGLLPGAAGLRLVTMLGTLTAVPLWRALKPRLSLALPWLAPTAQAHYCTGFLAFAALAAAIRAAGAAPVSEILGMCGLWLFCAALVTHFKRRPDTTGPAGSIQ